MNKQVSYVNLVPAFENTSGYFPFQGGITTDYKFKAWNVMAEWVPEFYGSPTEEALSGKKRGNLRGYRLKATIMLDYSLEASQLYNLFNKFSGGYNRLVWITTFASTLSGTQNFPIASPYPLANDWLNSLLAFGFIGSQESEIVTDYDASTQTVTLANSGLDTSTGNDISFYALPNVETVLLFDITGTSSVYNDMKLIPCNIISNNYGASREATINKQRISLEVESIELYAEIPQEYIVS